MLVILLTAEERNQLCARCRHRSKRVRTPVEVLLSLLVKKMSCLFVCLGFMAYQSLLVI